MYPNNTLPNSFQGAAYKGLAVFDLDNTLLAGDSDDSWANYLLANNYISDTENWRTRAGDFYDHYQQGNLDIDAYVAFISAPIQKLWPDKLQQAQQDFIDSIIVPMMQPSAFALIDKHRKRGDHTMIMTATNQVVAAPICALFGVDSYMTTVLEMNHNGFTGRVEGIPCFREGKYTLLAKWLESHKQFSFRNTWFYSDSQNDLPLLQQVAFPVAVDPDDVLRTHAIQHDWRVMSLRNNQDIDIPYIQ